MLPGIGINVAHQLAHGKELAPILAWAAALSVVLAGITPITFTRALRQRSIIGTLVSVFLFCVCLGFNIANAVGIAAGKRAETVTSREVERGEVERLQWQLGTARESRGALVRDAEGKTATMIRAELASMRQQWQWDSSKRCTDATLSSSRIFCADYKKREGLLDAAAKVEQLNGQIADISAKLAGMHATAGQAADPQASAVNFALAWFGIQAKDGDVGTGLSLWFALAIEAIGSLGPIAFALLLEPAHGRAQDAHHMPKDARPPMGMAEAPGAAQAVTPWAGQPIIAGEPAPPKAQNDDIVDENMACPGVPKNGQDGNASMGSLMGTKDMPMGTPPLPHGQGSVNGQPWAPRPNKVPTECPKGANVVPIRPLPPERPTKAEVERAILETATKQAAADRLGISRRTMGRILEEPARLGAHKPIVDSVRR